MSEMVGHPCGPDDGRFRGRNTGASVGRRGPSGPRLHGGRDEGLKIDVRHGHARGAGPFMAAISPDRGSAGGFLVAMIMAATGNLLAGPRVAVAQITSCEVPPRELTRLSADTPDDTQRSVRGLGIQGIHVFVGRPRAAPNGLDSGVVDVHERRGDVWKALSPIVDSAGALHDKFGHTLVAHDATLLIGAPGDDERGGNAGAVHVFERCVWNWRQVATLLPPEGYGGATFGWSLDFDGEVAVVGVPGIEGGLTGSFLGEARVLRKTSAAWVEEETLQAAIRDTDDSYAASVAVDGEWVFVGAPEYNLGHSMASGTGRVEVFRHVDGTWSRTATLRGSRVCRGSLFGWSVDVDGDTAVIGTNRELSCADPGGAYVFERDGDVWLERAIIAPPDGATVSGFGIEVSIRGDTILVGSPWEDEAGVNTGASFVYRRMGDQWIFRERFLPEVVASGDGNGRRFALDDGRALVGAWRYATVFDLCGGPVEEPTSPWAFTIDDFLAVLARWGSGEACPEDVNCDGVVDILDFIVVLVNWI